MEKIKELCWCLSMLIVACGNNKASLCIVRVCKIHHTQISVGYGEVFCFRISKLCTMWHILDLFQSMPFEYCNPKKHVTKQRIKAKNKTKEWKFARTNLFFTVYSVECASHSVTVSKCNSKANKAWRACTEFAFSVYIYFECRALCHSIANPYSIKCARLYSFRVSWHLFDAMYVKKQKIVESQEWITWMCHVQSHHSMRKIKNTRSLEAFIWHPTFILYQETRVGRVCSPFPAENETNPNEYIYTI